MPNLNIGFYGGVDRTCVSFLYRFVAVPWCAVVLFGTSSAQGGAGGVNVSYSCGSQVVYSYGGGGGGAVSTGGLFGTGVSVDGGAGGSGSSGVSDTSYVKIYRFG